MRKPISVPVISVTLPVASFNSKSKVYKFGCSALHAFTFGILCFIKRNQVAQPSGFYLNSLLPYSLTGSILQGVSYSTDPGCRTCHRYIQPEDALFILFLSRVQRLLYSRLYTVSGYYINRHRARYHSIATYPGTRDKHPHSIGTLRVQSYCHPPEVYRVISHSAAVFEPWL